MRKVYLVGGKRTPIGSLMGSLSAVSGTELCAVAVRALLQDLKLSGTEINSVILGNVLSSGLGQNPARQVAMLAGIPDQASCTNVNKVCASGMKAAMYGALEIRGGEADLCLVGGFESMSNAPHLIKKSRHGFKFGEFQAEDAILTDGLTDAFSKLKMGHCAEKSAKDYQITRPQQDLYCINSYERTLKSQQNELKKHEITPVSTPKGIVFTDEEPKRYDKKKVETAKLAFAEKGKGGTVTPANASKINDGACVLLLASEDALQRYGLKPLAEVVSFADAEVKPIDFNIAPTFAVRKALEKAKLEAGQVDFWEVNEAFSVTPLVFMKELNVPLEKMNPMGGAVSLGHPIGMSGARIILSLLNDLRILGGKLGCAAICNGGGGASAFLLRLCPTPSSLA